MLSEAKNENIGNCSSQRQEMHWCASCTNSFFSHAICGTFKRTWPILSRHCTKSRGKQNYAGEDAGLQDHTFFDPSFISPPLPPLHYRDRVASVNQSYAPLAQWCQPMRNPSDNLDDIIYPQLCGVQVKLQRYIMLADPSKICLEISNVNNGC